MIRVTIERVTIERYKRVQNFLISKEPTGIEETSDYGRNRVTYKEVNEPREVEDERTITTLLLKQEILDEAQFDFADVVGAINGLVSAIRP